MKKTMLMSLLIASLVISGCLPPQEVSNEAPVCPEPGVREVIINKTVYVNNTIYLNSTNELECFNFNSTYDDLYNSTLPYILQIKRLDRQLEKCMHSNESYYNKTAENVCYRCQRELNYTKNIMEKWQRFVN